MRVLDAALGSKRMPLWMPVMSLPDALFIRLLSLRSSVWLCCSDKLPRTKIWKKTTAEQLFRNSRLKPPKGEAR